MFARQDWKEFKIEPLAPESKCFKLAENEITSPNDKKLQMVHNLACRVFYFHMKDAFLAYLKDFKKVPNDVAHMNLNRKPNYNTFRGIFSKLNQWYK